MEYDSALYINEITKFAVKWTELRGIILSEVTQIQKEKKTACSPSYGILLYCGVEEGVYK